MTTWQKLLMPGMADAMLQGGLAEFGGPVVREADVARARPAELVRAYGLAGDGLVFPEDPAHVDLLLFEQRPLMHFEKPANIGERPWPTYQTGFLHGAPVPVWNLARTRVPSGSSIYRKHADGRLERLSTLASPAKGWTGARGYFPPLHVVGPRAQWRGLDLPADFLPNDQPGVELTWIGDDDVPEGFEQIRPMIHRRLAPFDECDEIFEVVITATYRGTPVRVLQAAGDEALILLENPTWDTVQALQPGVVEPGCFEMSVPMAEIENMSTVTNVWTSEASTSDAPSGGSR